MLIEGWKAGKVLHIIILYELSRRVLGEKQNFPQNFQIGAEISLKHVMKTDSSCKGFKFGTWVELGHEKTTMEFHNYWIFKSLMQICKPFAHLRGKKDWNLDSAIVVSIRNLICMDLPPQCPWEFLFIVHKKESRLSAYVWGSPFWNHFSPFVPNICPLMFIVSTFLCWQHFGVCYWNRDKTGCSVFCYSSRCQWVVLIHNCIFRSQCLFLASHKSPIVNTCSESIWCFLFAGC